MKIEKKFSFAICTNQRTGSTLLCQILSEIGIGNAGEYFSRRFEAEFDMKDVIDEILFSVMKKGESENGIKGIKIMIGQLQHLVFLVNKAKKTAYTPDDIMALCQIDKYIFLRRKNKLRQAISHYKAHESNNWLVKVDRSVKVKNIAYNGIKIKRLLHLIQQKELEWVIFFDRNNIQPLEIYYEDLIEQYHETLTEINTFLGVKLPEDFQFPTPPLQKQANDESEVFYHRFQNPTWYDSVSIFFYKVIISNKLLYIILRPIYRFFIKS